MVRDFLEPYCRTVVADIYEQSLVVLMDGPELCRTLGVYLLDAGAGVTRTAELLYIHKNTVKYRLQKITDCLGCRVGRMPESFAVYYAVALKRLLERV